MKKVRILTIDGGGIRGIIPATVIQYVEEKLIELTNNPNARIADYFDFVAGTSTGGILTCFYLTPNTNKGENKVLSKYKASEALEFYSDLGYSIFNQSRRHGFWGLRQLFNATNFSPTNLENIFLKEFGDLKLSELLRPCIITTYCISDRSSFFFSSVEPINKRRDFFVRDVARSTSAAPTYFPPAKIRNLVDNEFMTNIDGGVFANNPTLCAYAECRNQVFPQTDYPTAKDMLILSIGTGGGQFDLPNVSKSKRWGVINWAKSIPEIMMDGSIDTVDYQMKNLFGTLERKYQKNYKRIDVPVNMRNYSSDMANASPANIEALKTAGERTLHSALTDKKDELGLDQFIELLIENSKD